jgi:hypothetical protein
MKPVAYEFKHPNGHAIVDYGSDTHLGPLPEEKGYVAHPLIYAEPLTTAAEEARAILLAMHEDPWAYRGGDSIKRLQEVAQKIGLALSDEASPKTPARRFTGVGHLEQTGYIPQGSADERTELAAFDAWVKSKGPLCASGRFSPTAHEAWLERAREADRLINRMTAMVKWLEANQPDVFTRGLWDAMNDADAELSRQPSPTR